MAFSTTERSTDAAGVDLAEHVAGPDPTRLRGSRAASGVPVVVSCRVRVRPSASAGTRKTPMPSGVVAGTSRSSAINPASTLVLVPSSTQPSPSGLAVVVGTNGSASGSTSAAAGTKRAGGQTGEERSLLLGGAEAGDRHPRERERRQGGHGRGPAAHLLRARGTARARPAPRRRAPRAPRCRAVRRRPWRPRGRGRSGGRRAPRGRAGPRASTCRRGAWWRPRRSPPARRSDRSPCRLPLSAWPWACPCRTRRSGLVGARWSHRRR